MEEGFQAAFDGRSLSSLTEADLFGHVKNSARWQAVNFVWQYWADRFYATLSNAELQLIAERKGNETAFTLVNDQPVKENQYTDTVSGAVSNRYFYRLRCIGRNLAISTEWGLVSKPGKIAVPGVRPRTPVWTKVEAGDREAALAWALNREPDIRGYKLFRADDPALLEDLRWAEVDLPEGLTIRTIPDPRILSRPGNSLLLPESLAAAEVVGVFRAFEFADGIPNPALQPAMNFYKNKNEGSSGFGKLRAKVVHFGNFVCVRR